jgi:dipeptidyl-peptidase-4
LNFKAPYGFKAPYVLLAAALLAYAQQPAKAPPTFEWVFGEGRTVSSVPATQWLSDGALMLLDSRRPAAERAFEILDPATGTRRRAFDMATAVASLNALRAKASALPVLAWPQAMAPSGRRALYVLDGDLFLLDVPSASFTKLTSTAAEEKSAEFSPDGRLVAFVRANDLFVVDCATRAETRLTRDGSKTTLNGTLSWVYWEEIFGRRDIGYWWSPDSKGVAYLQTDESRVPLVSFVDFQPETPRVITQRYPKAGQPNPKVRVGIVGVDAAVTRWVQIADKPFDMVLRVKWLPDGKRLSVQTETRDQKEVRLYLVDRLTGVASRILTETGTGWINMHDDLFFLADGRRFLWASERDGQYHIYRYTLDGTLVNQVTRGAWSLSSSGGVGWVRQAVAGIDERAGRMYFTAMERSSVTRDLYRVGIDGTGFTRVSSEPGVHRILMAPDTRFYLDTFSDVKTLPSMTLRKADGSVAQVIAPPRMEMLAPFDIQWPELTTIPASDGFKMPARILRPAGFRADRRYPVIMHVYGGASLPVVSNAWAGDTLFYQLLLAEGYVVVKVDNRSATAISKTLENSVIGRLGEGEAADLVDAAKWLKSQPWVDPDRVGVWGWSNGGYMTLNLMTRSDAFKAGIAVAPVTDWRYYDSRWAEAFLGMPEQNAKAYDDASVITRAAALHGRVLIVYGSYDDNVHPQNELAFIDALIKAGKQFDLMLYPMRKHDIGDRDANLHLYRMMIDFWKRNL